VEGTRATPEKLSDSQAFSKSRGLHVYEHVLYPRTKGWCVAMEELRHSCRAVYTFTLAFPPAGTHASGTHTGIPTLQSLFAGKEQVCVCVCVCPLCECVCVCQFSLSLTHTFPHRRSTRTWSASPLRTCLWVPQSPRAKQTQTRLRNGAPSQHTRAFIHSIRRHISRTMHTCACFTLQNAITFVT
jgi:hypothetical protein